MAATTPIVTPQPRPQEPISAMSIPISHLISPLNRSSAVSYTNISQSAQPHSAFVQYERRDTTSTVPFNDVSRTERRETTVLTRD